MDRQTNSSVYLCDGICINITEPCNNSCIKPNEIPCSGRCVDMTNSKVWLCNGVCQSWYDPCDNGRCRGFMSVFQPQVVGNDLNHYIDTYWKCPDEEKCISSDHFCNNIMRSPPSPRDTCFNDAQKSRIFCENPDKFNFNLNCSSNNLIFCPGNKTQQCIYNEDLCNGFYDCNDR